MLPLRPKKGSSPVHPAIFGTRFLEKEAGFLFQQTVWESTRPLMVVTVLPRAGLAILSKPSELISALHLQWGRLRCP